MSETIKLCQEYTVAMICCLPEGHGGSHYPVHVEQEWLAMIHSIRYKDARIKELQDKLRKYEPTREDDDERA